MPPVTKLNVCSQCSQSFVVKDLHHPRGSRCPILLHCGHSVCELCLRNHMKPKTGMNCLICGIATIPKSEKLTEIIEEFSPHMYLVGHMTISHSSRLPVDVKLNFLPAGASANTGFFLTNRKKATISSNQLEVCEECNNQTAIWHCEKCMENFCQMCWTKTHSMTKGLRKHVSMPIAKSKNTNNVLKQCPVHDTQMLEFYCKICDVVICSHCLLLSHQGSGHCPITLKEKNEERALAVEAAAEELESTVQRMRHTLKKSHQKKAKRSRTHRERADESKKR